MSVGRKGKAVELFQVRYFLELAKSLNFSRAAEACSVSQPAMTRAIQRLEEELGGRLLYRERNLTQLTPLGQAMLPLLEAAHAAAETAAAQAAAFRRRASAPLRLGVELDLAIMAEPQGIAERFRVERLYHERFVFAFPPGHRFELMQCAPSIAAENPMSRGPIANTAGIGTISWRRTRST